MTRILNRVGELARFVVSLRGLLILTAFGLAIVALVLDNAPRWVGALSLGLWALVLSLASLRQAEVNLSVRGLKRELAILSRSVHVSAHTREGKALPYGPRGRSWLAVEHARSKLQQARTQLAMPDQHAQTERRVAADRDFVQTEFLDPLISVIVPCYNDSEFIEDCLKSLKGQIFDDWECIVVDDASTDHSPSIIASFTESDERFRFVRHGVNSGLSAARNTGLRLSRGQLVSFLDADDLLRPDNLLDRVEALSPCWGDELVVGSFSGVSVGSEVTSVNDLGISEKWAPATEFIDFINGAEDCPFPVLAPLVRRDVVVGLGGFDEALKIGAEDWDLWLRILRAGYIFVPSSLRSAIYRQRPGSMTKRDAAEHVKQGALLTHRAYSSVTDSMALSTPYPFTRGLDHYRQVLSVSRRAIRTGGMALINGDRDQAMACLDVLERGTWAWLDRHLNVEATAGDGVRRGLGIDTEQLDELRDDVLAFVSEIVDDVYERTVASDRGSGPADPMKVEVLLAPLNGAQLKAMTAAFSHHGRRDEGTNVGVLVLDRLTGNQGVDHVLDSADLPSWSLNEWWLGHHTLRTLVVPSVRDTTLEGLISVAEKSGVRVVEAEEPGAEIMRVLERIEGPGLQSSVGVDSEPYLRLAIDRTSAFAGGALNDPIAPETIWHVEESAVLRVDSADIQRFENRHKGERVVIVGNGPSLNKTDLRKLEGTCSIGVNAIFLATEQTGFRPTYYVVEDTAVVRDNLARIRDYKAEEHRFFPSIYRDAIGESSDTSFFNMNTGFYAKRSPSYSVPRFSTDASLRLFAGQSVTIINLQLAYYMGFSEVVLIGMDFSYTVPESSVVEGNQILSLGDDPNHFHPDYFGKGKVWKDPKLDRVLASYQLAKLMYEVDGRRIVNATAGGKLELFERVEYNDLF